MEKKNEERSSGQEDMLCKILLTSRFHDVLSVMTDEKDRVFAVHELNDDEAWHLFKKIVGSKVESPDFQRTANEIVKTCLGLPVAIASVGKAMKGKTRQHEWKTALKELKKPTPEGISAAVYKPIELSYKYLQGNELKRTFMLCSLLGHDSSIDDLLKYGMGLNLFEKVETMEETRDKVLTLVHSLKLSSLLLDGQSHMHFGMHDQIREVALSIASRDHGVLALVGEDGGNDWPENETMENLKWIHLSNGYPELMSNGLKCPQLTFFHLSNKGCSLALPTDLFTGTDGLKLLCLTKIDFQSMPSQIPLIPTKLKTLLLDQCVFRVEELCTIMGNLEKLEVLSLAGCDIEELPREMEKLTRLKLLDVSDCTKLKVIPRQVLSRLSKLEELKMGNSFDQWDDMEGGNARLAELTELRMLTALEVRIPNFEETLFLENLERFKIFIGIVDMKCFEFEDHWGDYSWDSYSWNSSFESSKIIKLKLQGASIRSNDSVKKLLKKTEELYLEGLNGVESLVDELDDEGFQHLKCLHVQHAPDIRCIFNPAGRLLPSHVFPSLAVLILFNLEKMEKICYGLTGAAPFKVLRKIAVAWCHQLKNLFSFSMAGQLQLQEITVTSCHNIEEIIDDVEEQGNGNDIVEESEGCKLGSLWSLTLEDLPKLNGFNSSNCSDISLFNDKVLFPNLEELKLDGIKINQLWITSSCVVTPQEILNFGKLKRLVLSGCSSLEYLFTPSMVSGLVQLEDLYVSSCQDLKQVIVVKGVEEVVNTTELIFPRLNSISLSYCFKLSSFYAGSYALKFQSAIRISIEVCPNMTTFASTFSTEKEQGTTYQGTEGRLEKKEPDICSRTFFYDTVDIPLLDDLYLWSIGAQQIWHSQITSMSSFVQNLRKLTLWHFDNSKYLFTSSMVNSFEQLEVLHINACKEIEVVILMEELVEKERTNQIMFPKLDNLELYDLPQLVRFCSNYNSLGEGYEAQGLNGSGSQVITATQSNLVETEVTQLVFPQVTYMQLRRLLNFKGFFPQIHITKWPLLRRMWVQKCDEMKTFASEFPSNEKAYGDSQLKRQTQHPMFWISKDSFPCLEQLELEQNVNMKEIWRGQYPGVYFPKLKDFKLLQFQNCSALLHSFNFFFQTLPSLEKLDVSEASFHEIFQCERLLSEGRAVDAPSRLIELKLSKLNGLMHLWKEESGLKLIFRNLRTLEVVECIKLVNLEPSVVSFENLQTLEISKCHGLENLVSYSTGKSLEQLKRISIIDCDLVEEIVKCLVDDVKDGIVFSQLESLQLRGLPKLSSFCTGKCDFEFPSLKEVIVIGCPQMACFSLGKTVTKELQNVQWINEEEKGRWVGDLNSTIQDLFSQKVGYFGFKNLKLSDEFYELIEIWKKNPEELTLPFKKVQHLEVCNCSSLSYLLTPSLALSLVQLEELKVKDCATMEQVIMVTGVEEVVETDLVLFPRLKSLLLKSCSKLSNFYVGSNTLKLPVLEKITVKDCIEMARFTSKFSSEKEKEIADGRSEEMLVKKEPNVFNEAFFYDAVNFPNLKLLKLSSININQIWNKNHEEISSFKKLQHLEVCNCSSLSYLLTPSMALSLVQLKDLKIKDCATMEQVIMAAGVEKVVETGLIFPQLKSILLESCSKLSSFYVGSNTLKFPMLEKIIVKNCLKRVRFASKFPTDREKEIADGRSEEVHVKESDIFIEVFFSDEFKIPILKTLTLSSINIKQIWNYQLSSISSFAQYLTKLKVVNCTNLKYLFTFSMVKSFVQLEELGISECEMMEVVILIEGMEEEEKICQRVFPKLEALGLNDLPQLATFCSSCDFLGEIFDSERVNVGTESQKLIARQSALVETEATKPVFSQVTYLILRLLPKFKSFFPQMHITEWPSLESLVVIECDGAQIVASELSSTEMTHGDNQLERESQHPMFWISKATFPSLEQLVVKWNDNIKIQRGHHPEGYFGKLRVLHLLGFPKQSAFLLPFFFHSLPNLEMLLVKDAFFDEIFQCEEVTGEEKPVCGRTQLWYLRLSKLHELTHLWKEESQLEVDILNNLETLKVQECSKLKNLVPSTVYFNNLLTLVVSECHGLVNLVRYSTAKSLGQLRRLKVANCETIEEIVVCLGDAVKDGIVFPKLWCLQLKGLPRLESFCSGDCNFKFPALEEVIVTECPNMQIFCKGELSTPDLHEVKLTGDIYEYMHKEIDEDIEKTIDDIFNEDEDGDGDEDEDERCWVGSLNSTVQQLFEDKRAHNSKKGNGENSDHGTKEDCN